MQYQRGFANHAWMGAALLGGLWLAIFLPGMLGAVRQGGWTAVLAVAAGLVGVLGAPILMTRFGGDELFGFLGILAALLAAWGSVKIAVLCHAAPGYLGSIRLGAAAVGPSALYFGIRLVAHVIDGRGSKPSPSSTE